MTAILPWYLLIGCSWALFSFERHPLIRQVRERLGDWPAVLAVFPVVLLWPVDAFGIVVYFLVCIWYRLKCKFAALSFRYAIWREVRRGTVFRIDELVGEPIDNDSSPVDSDKSMAIFSCVQCGRTIAVFGGVSTSLGLLDGAGWTTIPNPRNPTDDDLYYCPECSRKKGANCV